MSSVFKSFRYRGQIVSSIKRDEFDTSRFRFRTKIKGKTYSKTFVAATGSKTEQIEAALKALEDFRNEKQIDNNWFNSLDAADKEITFDEYFNKWLKVKKREWTKKNSSAIERTYKNHIKEVLGDLKVIEVTPVDISNLMDHLSKKESDAPLGKSLKKSVLSIVKRIYQKLINDEVVLKSPIKSIHEVKRNYHEEKKLVTNAVEQFKAVKDAIYELYGNDPKLLAAFLFGLLCGKRVMEVLTLKWTDINFDTRTFVIRAENNKVNSTMEFNLPKELIEVLKRIKRGKKKFIFSSDANKTGHITTLSHHYKKIRVQSGVEDYTFHYQRNIFVSAANEKGVADHKLSDALGHRDSSTLKIYLTANRVNASKSVSEVLEDI